MIPDSVRDAKRLTVHAPVDPKLAELSRLTIDRRRHATGPHSGRLLLGGIVAAVALISVAAGWWYYRTTGANILAAMTQPPVEVRLVTIPSPKAAAFATMLVATGQIVSDREVNVATKVSGQLVEMNVEQGDRVERDQVLACVEDVVYRAQRDESAANVARQRNAIARARFEHERAKAAVLQARANLDFEQRNFERLRRLSETGQASDFEYLNAKSRYEAALAAADVAKAEADATAAAVTVAEADLAAAEAVLRLMQKRLDDCAIRAPIGGVVLERNAQVGDFVAAEGGRGANANAQIVRVADMSLLRVEIDVSERDVGRLQPGQTARITPDADRTRSYDGRVLWIDPQGDYARAVVQVKVRILDPGPNLRVGGSAKVEFLAPAPEAATAAAAAPGTETTAGGPRSAWLPKSAVKLTPGSDEAVVFTVGGDGRALPNPVRVGTRSDKLVEVVSGVAPGMQIIADNVDKIEAGTAVRVVKSVSMDEL